MTIIANNEADADEFSQKLDKIIDRIDSSTMEKADQMVIIKFLDSLRNTVVTDDDEDKTQALTLNNYTYKLGAKERPCMISKFVCPFHWAIGTMPDSAAFCGLPKGEKCKAFAKAYKISGIL